MRTYLLLPVLLVAACSGGSAGGGTSSSSLDTGCFTISEAVSTFNDSQDATKAGTATTADTMKAYASAADKLKTAALILPTGHLQDLTSTAATALGRARVALDGGGADDADRAAVISALNEAAPLCKGHSG